MLRLRKTLRLTALAALAGACLAQPAAAAPEPAATIATDHVRAEFVLRNARTAPGERVEIAIRHTLEPGWHTYWRNPGDSGEPPIFEWSPGDAPQGLVAAPVQLGEMRFPAPERLPYPPLMNHGFEGEFTLLTSATVPADWPMGEPYPITVRADWLVCEAICIPEGGSTSVSIPTGPDTLADSAVAFTFVQAEWALPETPPTGAVYAADGDGLTLTLPAFEAASDAPAHLFALQRNALDHVAEQPAATGPDGALKLSLTRGSGALDGTLEGVVTLGDKAFWVSATGPELPALAAPVAGDASLSTTTQEAQPAGEDAPLASGAQNGAARLGFASALAFAFLGGLILNLMPCVFPVLAIKAMGLVSHADAPVGRRAAIAGAYASGVLASLAVVVAALLALRGAGTAAGWGFQLQDPAFVAAMTLLLFAFGLNLSGVFEVGGRLTALGARDRGTGVPGAFAAGALATVVATPCTAPFMAPALGAALTMPPPQAAGVFAALGLGLALPFAVLALAPGAARLMPAPGLWMVRLRQALAFPLYLTAAWLLWVLALLVGVEALLPALAALVLLALAAWLYGLGQRGRDRAHRAATGLAAASFAGALVALWPVAAPPVAATAAAPIASTNLPGAGGQAVFTPARLAELRASETSVFVNVTAAWCITCKVNERVVLSGEGFGQLLHETGTRYLTADWTRRDPDVTRFIERFGRAGVPLYVHFASDGTTTVLPQILTLSGLRETFEG